ncbi:MAG: glycosyltransferase family 2 protein [Syntrophobacterales bacterium]|nr:glycosyltransferase family 2 protein [Syntrophobacterales bacterium]
MIVIIPACNEERTIRQVVENVWRQIGCPIVVIDDGSTDDTAIEAFRGGAIVISHGRQLGAWTAIQTGLLFARHHRIFPVVTLDGDGQHEVEDISLLLEVYRKTGAHVVIGSCPDRASWMRKGAWSFLRFLTGLPVIDLTSGFRLYSKEAIEILTSKEALLLDYQDIGVLLILAKRGLSIVEVPVRMYERKAGHSRVFSNWGTVIRYMIYSSIFGISKRSL